MQPAKRDGSAEGGEREMIADGFLKAKTTRHARFLYIFSLFLCSSAQGTSSLSSRKRGQSSRQPERTRLAHSQTAVFFFFFPVVAGRSPVVVASVSSDANLVSFVPSLSSLGAKKTKGWCLGIYPARAMRGSGGGRWERREGKEKFEGGWGEKLEEAILGKWGER